MGCIKRMVTYNMTSVLHFADTGKALSLGFVPTSIVLMKYSKKTELEVPAVGAAWPPVSA